MSGVLRVANAPTVPSPCTDVCRIDSRSGWCEGCFRTIDEIAVWGALDDRARRAVCKLLPARRSSCHPEQGEGSQGPHQDPALRSGGQRQ